MLLGHKGERVEGGKKQRGKEEQKLLGTREGARASSDRPVDLKGTPRSPSKD